MTTGVHIGNKIDVETAIGPLSDAIDKVLESIATSRVDREVALKALEVLGFVASGPPMSFSHCAFYPVKDSPGKFYGNFPDHTTGGRDA